MMVFHSQVVGLGHSSKALECWRQWRLTLAVVRLGPGARVSRRIGGRLLVGRDGSGRRQAIGETGDGRQVRLLLLLVGGGRRRHGGTRWLWLCSPSRRGGGEHSKAGGGGGRSRGDVTRRGELKSARASAEQRRRWV